MQLVTTLAPADESLRADVTFTALPETPGSLARLARTRRFRQAVELVAQELGLDAAECSGQLSSASPAGELRTVHGV